MVRLALSFGLRRMRSVSAHRGAPSISNSQAEGFGDLQQVALRVTGDAITMQFPELFTNAWDLEDVKGDLMLLFRPGYASVRGENIVLPLVGVELAADLRPAVREHDMSNASR